MKAKSLIVGISSICLGISLLGCSSSAVPSVKNLAATSKTQNYYYCESCPVPTKLVKQEYLPLEPDEPIIKIEPVVISAQTKPTKRRIKHKKHRKRKSTINSQTNRKLQCVQWK